MYFRSKPYFVCHFVFKTARRCSSVLSYRHQLGTEPLRAKTVGVVLEETAKKYGEEYAVISRHQNKRLTFTELLTNADKLAAALKELGFGKNDRLGIWAPNMIEWLVAKMACARGGFITVALNPLYQAPEMQYCINKVGIKGIICGDTFRNQNYYDIMCDIEPKLSESVPGKLKSDIIPSLNTLISISSKTLRGAFNFDELLRRAEQSTVDSIRANQNDIQPDDLFSVMFTSGTTGQPKATIGTHFNLVNNGYFVGKRNELSKTRHKICVMVPLFHAFGTTITIMAALNHGTTLVLPAPGYSPTKSLETIRDEQCSIIHGTPTMYVDLIQKQRELQLDIKAQIAITGGAICSPHLFKEMKSVLKLEKVKSVFGLTETTAVVFQSLENEDEEAVTTTVGSVSDHIEVKVVDSKNKLVPFGTVGELCVRGYLNILGYWGDEVKTKELIGTDGWLKTGDLFILNENGYGKIVGRIKELIIRGGENISPREVEDFLNKHPSILDTQVVGLPHERYGEEVCACIRLKNNNNTVTLTDIEDFCKGNIAPFKIPTKLRIFDVFPKTTSGKIQKHKLVELVLKQ